MPAGVYPRKPAPQRFWALVNQSGDCWEWQGHRARNGYGIFAVKYPDKQLAHRFAYQDRVGPIAEGLNVCHRCDNPPCVRPDHLFLGTPSDNQVDRVRKGRTISNMCPERIPRGERSGNAKLTDAAILAIRARYAAGGVRQVDLAREYGVEQPTISAIIRRERWTHL